MMKIYDTAVVAILAPILALATCHANDADASQETPTSGEVIGEVVKESGIEVARGVSVVSHATADTLDGLTWGGCALAKWAIGGREDRDAGMGNLVVGLVFRLPVAAVGAGVCVATAIAALPIKGIGYGFDALTGNKSPKP